MRMLVDAEARGRVRKVSLVFWMRHKMNLIANPLTLFATLQYQDPINDDDMKAMFNVFAADGASCSQDDFKAGLQSMGDKITDEAGQKAYFNGGEQGQKFFRKMAGG